MCIHIYIWNTYIYILRGERWLVMKKIHILNIYIYNLQLNYLKDQEDLKAQGTG